MEEIIIIDGVNVAGCIYYNAEKLANCGMFAQGDFKCEGQICLYKQLKRLEQENAELKAYKDVNEDFKTAWEELKTENERLKQEWRLDCLKCEYKNTKADVDKYKQTLQEIKTIAENAYCLTNYTNKDMADFAKQILATITKAEEE